MEDIVIKGKYSAEDEQKEKVHPWRLCPLGKHSCQRTSRANFTKQETS